MITIHRDEERFHTELGWLDSRHSFSFGEHHDPRRLGFRGLRVINEDRVAPRGGFPPHPHHDMEILSLVLAGQLEHRDSLGNGSVIRAGELQRMSAGTGVRHSEGNPSPDEAVHFLQIWIEPERAGLPPGYEQRVIPQGEGLTLLASPDAAEGSLRHHADARLYRARLAAGQRLERPIPRGRHAWVQVLGGELRLGDLGLRAGDGAALSAEDRLELTAPSDADALIFELA